MKKLRIMAFLAGLCAIFGCSAKGFKVVELDGGVLSWKGKLEQ